MKVLTRLLIAATTAVQATARGASAVELTDEEAEKGGEDH